MTDSPDKNAQTPDAATPTAGTAPDATQPAGSAETTGTTPSPAETSPADETGTTGSAAVPEATPAGDAAPPKETQAASGAGPDVPAVPEPAAPPATSPPPHGPKAEDMKEAPLMEHLVELRTRLVRALIAVGLGFVACYAFAEKLLGILLRPLLDVMPGSSKLIATSLPETFFTVMKLALVAGAFVASPYIFYQLWKFVAPGLYKEERKIIIPVAISTAVCFVGGALFGYFIVFPFGFKFFVDYASDYITVMPTISAYFTLAVTLLFAFGIIFELPVFIFFMTSLGLVTTKALRKFRRWAILLSFIVAAILTPTPDAINQLLMAGPMVILYEVGIWVSWFVDKSRKAEKAAKEAAQAAAAQTPDGEKPEAAPEAAEPTATASDEKDDPSRAG